MELYQPSLCAANPPPANWDRVPKEDHERLNCVLTGWRDAYGDVREVELEITPTGYTWRLFLRPNAMVAARQLRAIQACHSAVRLAECCLDVEGPNARGAVCVYVYSTAADTRTDDWRALQVERTCEADAACIALTNNLRAEHAADLRAVAAAARRLTGNV